ncbi:transcription termination factor 3, mitochondrial [Phymastichus coffea]|uniref:transcription termination factor 3, mitochondrial n=1 Tax=Phymastichus coffea TaxID=108790 RepID=UPI00273C6049|nr:transcription termination factor 3, mitochondrial [Phymastichus coffea]
MLNTNFCRYKALLKLSQSALNSDLGNKIGLRFYAGKVIYSSESPQNLWYKSENPNEQERTLGNQRFTQKNSRYEKECEPRNSYGQGQNNFKQEALYKKNYGHRNNSYQMKNKHRNTSEKNTYFDQGINAPTEIFDAKYAFLDNTNKVVIKPRNPHKKDDYDSTENQQCKRNYKITDNPLYSKVLPCEDDRIDDGIELKSDHVDHDRPVKKLKKKYSFDSNLVFEESDIDNASPLKIDIINVSNENNTPECIVDTTSTDSITNTSLIKTNLKPRLKTIDTPEGLVTLNLTDDEFDLDDFIKEFNEEIPGPLDECNEDISYFGPDFSPTFNFAAYADKSKLIQQYVKLGVKLYKVEKNMDHMRALLSVDLEKELPIYIQFLHDCGIPANCLGDAITESPMLLKEDLDDMKTRIRYLRAHNFTPGSISRIITKNPSWLLWATKFIDERLGHFQNEFKLGGSDMRFLATKAPKLITYPMRHVNENTFAIREQMGFNKLETKLLLLYKPRLWMNSRRKIVDSFDYLHNTMQLSHVMIASQADVLTTRKSRIKSRHEFLVELKKAQYDPKKPGYIAPRTIVIGSDADFCTKVAKTAVDTYNLFLRTR